MLKCGLGGLQGLGKHSSQQIHLQRQMLDKYIWKLKCLCMKAEIMATPSTTRVGHNIMSQTS